MQDIDIYIKLSIHKYTWPYEQKAYLRLLSWHTRTVSICYL